MLLKNYGDYCITKQGNREEKTNCLECKQKDKEDCTTALLTQKINENVKRINDLFSIKNKKNGY